jgi:hypothetical protein
MKNGGAWKNIGKGLVLRKSDVSSIRICKCYDGVVFPEEYIQDKSAKVEAIFKDMMAAPQRYAWDRKNKDQLLFSPEIRVAPVTGETHDGVPVIGQVSYKYKTHIPKQQLNVIQKMWRVLFWWSLIGAIVTLPIMIFLMRRNEIDIQCYYYTKHGVPDVVEIDGMEYHIDSNGLVTQEERSGINPYHYEILRNVSGNCVHIDVP